MLCTAATYDQAYASQGNYYDNSQFREEPVQVRWFFALFCVNKPSKPPSA